MAQYLSAICCDNADTAACTCPKGDDMRTARLDYLRTALGTTRRPPFFRCTCGKLHTRSALITITTTCVCGVRLHALNWG